ncbi:hypothetical protein [Shewanella insulae]|uniref:hypothetical protein n=1 Tax=Shewanella insulae TaxID=2681496 RepID=UPI00247FC575|nr:hypothetical protein [Shewanella insulae]
MSAEVTKAIVLQTTEEEHIGFTLFHPDFETNSGDCVFVVVPKKAELFDSEEVLILLNIKEAGEHQWVRTDEDVTVSFNGVEQLKYAKNGNLIHLPTNKVLGIWFPAKGK